MFLFVAEREALWAKQLEELRQELAELAESGGEKRKREIEVEKPKKKPRESVVDRLDPPVLRKSPRATPQRNYCGAGQDESDPDWHPSDDEEPRKSRPRKKVSSGGKRTRRAESPPPDRGGKRRRQQKLPESELDHCGDEMGKKVCFEQGLTPTCQ